MSAVLVRLVVAVMGVSLMTGCSGGGGDAAAPPTSTTTSAAATTTPGGQTQASDLREAEHGVVAWVTDGDTIRVKLDGGQTTTRVRLIGLDTPETYTAAECWGAEATAAMKTLLKPNDPVALTIDTTQDEVDRYGRLLRYVQLPDGSDAGERQIAAGAGRVYVYDHDFAKLADYRRAQKSARAAGAGLWSHCS